MRDLSRYFDFNATTPMLEPAEKMWIEATRSLWHNPSSLYAEAGYAKQRLEDAREDLAEVLSIDEPERIVFTSGATEANNAVIRHFSETTEGRLAVSAIEHPCVEASSMKYFGPERLFIIPADPDTGVVDVDLLRKEVATGTVEAVSVMAANNETGTLQPWPEISTLCRENGIPFHCDAAQWVGKMPLEGLGKCNWLTASGHKFGGGKGVGFLLVPEEETGFHASVGGPQEDGRRAGTESVAAVIAMVEALEFVVDEWLSTSAEDGRNAFEDAVARSLDARVIGAGGSRLWNTSMILLPHGKNLKWLTRLGQRGFAVSTGSACSAGRGNPSKVMAAMGLDFDEMGRVLRLSGGWKTSVEDWLALAGALEEVSAELRG
ncbi:MAG: aminotransferase class V-fold PLP-dependent enzyme [Verrucomicrobiales bacterium]|nr:aminotransferase class V-fold PLP-dependent enzyme [Verrucomicrobiales bacterium]